MGYDQTLFALLFSITGQTVILDALIILFASWWELIVAAAIITYLLWGSRSREDQITPAKNVMWAIVSALIARFGVVSAVRVFYPRPRPFVSEQLIPLVDHVASPGFPSGHAAFFMALATYFLLRGERDKKFGWFLLASAVLIGIARVAAGIHWPSDIIAGWVVGAFVSMVVWRFFKRRKTSMRSLDT